MITKMKLQIYILRYEIRVMTLMQKHIRWIDNHIYNKLA